MRSVPALVVVVASLAASTGAAQRIVVVADGVDGETVASEARRVEGARVEVVRAAASETAGGPDLAEAGLARAHAAFVDAEFARCDAELRVPETDADDALARGRPDVAARALGLAALCAFGAGDAPRAREAVARLYVHALDPRSLVDAPVALREMADEVRRTVEAEPLLSVQVHVEAAGARLEIDGRAVPCDASPCAASLRAGAHVLRATAAGRAPATTRVLIDGPRTIDLRPAPSAPHAARAIADAIRATGPPGRGMLAAAGLERDGDVALCAFLAGDDAVVVVLDANGALIARGSGSRSDLATTARAVLAAWQDARRGPITSEPLFWIAVGAGALAVGATVLAVLLSSPEGAPSRELCPFGC